MNKRPEKNEYAEYYEGYISLVRETDIVSAMRKTFADAENIFASIDEEKGSFAYAPGKWTIKQLLGHLIDGERIFSYRALRISRGDKTPLASFEQDAFVENANFDRAKFDDLKNEFSNLCRADILFFQNLEEAAWSQTGTASENTVSVLAIAYTMVGHVRHHLNVLREKYLSE